ncbi:unnamed protein product [Bursaphelenchus xylophilus]|uniref:(pine wood nematode) hypothetical protein n=1 Tax=Bursaphelenchus xylophilus TaxID=6326 RepID=A0A1I7SRV1_BURXY|nr:unnamed protein product [Bursaphelenchus xylophilus]CAG9101820.1 unnamed protein product [Bursaphelenchus xylophilus]
MNSLYLLALFVPLAMSTAPITSQINKPIAGGQFTYYDAVGNGACGEPLKKCTAALSAKLFDPAAKWGPSPKDASKYVLQDPACNDLCVKIEYKGKTASFPIQDKCPGCEPNHVDLSEDAFKVLESNLGVGKATPATITYLPCSQTKISC